MEAVTFNKDKKAKKYQFHIIDGRIKQNKFLHPLHGNSDKSPLKKILQKILKINNFENVNNPNPLFSLNILGEKKIIYLDTMDFGGTENAVKLEIPWSKKDFRKSVLKDQIPIIINLFFPLISTKDKYKFLIDEKNIIFTILSPWQIIKSKGYKQIFSPLNSSKINNSNRWIRIKELLDIYRKKKSIYVCHSKSWKDKISEQKKYIYSGILSESDYQKEFSIFQKEEFKLKSFFKLKIQNCYRYTIQILKQAFQKIFNW